MEFLRILESLRFPPLTAFMSAVTYLGDELCFMALALLVFWCFDKRKGYYIFAVGLMGSIVNQFLKLWFRIPRPWVLDPDFHAVESAIEGAGGYSFPSGHTQTAVGNFGALALSTDKKWLRLLCAAAIIIVPFSRMYLGVHTPLDVGVSYLFAGTLVVLLYFCFKDDGSFARRAPLVMLALLALALLYALFIGLYNFPADIDPHNMESGTKNACTLGGTSLAMVFIWLHDKKLNFSTKAPLLGQILKYVLGLALVVALKAGLKPVLNGLLGLFLSGGALTNVSNFLRYFLMSLFAGCVWPYSFKFFAKLGAGK